MTKRSFPDKLGVFLPCENGGEDHTDLLENQIMGGKKTWNSAIPNFYCQ